VAATKVDVDVGKPLIIWVKDDSVVVAEAMRARLVARTRQLHTGADGQKFTPYARPYKDHPDLAAVNLTKTGAMLDTLKKKATKTRAEVVPTLTHAFIQNARRPWIGFTEQEIDSLLMTAVILPIIDQHLADADEEAGRNG